MVENSPGTMLADRTVLRLAGDEVRGFLQGLLTNDLALLAPRAPQWTALLTPQGKALVDMILWADDDAVLIDCEASQAEGLRRRLAAYRLRRAVTIEPSSARVHWSPNAVAEASSDPRLAALGYRWIGEPAMPAEGWLRHRLSLGVTEGVAELGNGETLWLECNARELGGVSLTKGCYVGQENTARMHHRAKVNRRLVVVPSSDVGERSRTTYPAIGLGVELRRIEALGDALRPSWLTTALEEAQRPTAT